MDGDLATCHSVLLNPSSHGSADAGRSLDVCLQESDNEKVA